MRQCQRQLVFVDKARAERHYRPRYQVPTYVNERQAAWELLQQVLRHPDVTDETKYECLMAAPADCWPPWNK
jgi:hypothetical protein